MTGNIKIGGSFPGGSGGGGSGTVTKVAVTGAGIAASPSPITGAGTLSVEWNGGTVTALGGNLSLTSGTLDAVGGSGVGTVTAGTNISVANPTGPEATVALGTLEAASVFGNAGTAAGDASSIAIGTGLDISSGTLVATGSVAANLVLTDGTTTVNPTATITVSGAAVTDLGGGNGELTITGSGVTSVIAEAGPFLAGGTITSTGTIANSITSLTASAILLGAGTAAVTALGSLGTTTTVLHGNAAGAPTFGAVSLSADVTGLLPFANIATLAAKSLFGNSGTVGAAGSAIAIGANLTLAGGTLSATAGGSGVGTIVGGGISSSGTLVPLASPVISVPAASSFTILNANSATAVDNTNGPLVFSSTTRSAVNGYTMAYKAVSGSFTLTVNIGYLTTNESMGIGITDGTKSHAITFHQTDRGIYVQRWTNTSTFGSSDVSNAYPGTLANPIWMRIIWNSGTTTITFQFSNDGFIWATVYTTATPFVAAPNGAGLWFSTSSASGQILIAETLNYWSGL